MSGGDHEAIRGTGFVHLNTPASIQYTTGQTLSLSALRQRKSRVECVVLPESMAVWRRAFQRYTKEEGYNSYAADLQDERMGNGVVLPSLVPQRSGPQRRRASDRVSTRDAFFCAAATNTQTRSETVAETPSSSAALPPHALGDASSSAASSSVAVSAAPSEPTNAGITIVSHHKVGGRQQFVYPDHDGVLSAGVVPQIVVTAEEKAEEEAAKVFYIAALDMSEQELAALEELQALWRSRARSHSFLGSQHRNAAKGSTDPSATEDAVTVGSDGRVLKARRLDGGGETESDASFAEAEMAVDDASTLDKELAEALRLADELLRFA